ncbi:MAG TPA: hypothetical protein VJS89_00820 [Gammaproteobacteria bacterium]|nr:hypothetical protein [Gammaproteobacteria bacterium]
MQSQDSSASRQYICHIDVSLGIQATETPKVSLNWPADDYIDGTRAVCAFLRPLKKLWLKTASLSHTSLDFELLGLIDLKSKIESLRLVVYAEFPAGQNEDLWSEDRCPALRSRLMGVLHKFVDIKMKFGSAIKGGKHPSIIVSNTAGTADDICCDDLLVVKAAQRSIFSDASHKETRPALKIYSDKGEQFELPPACQLDISSEPETSAIGTASGYLQELNTQKGTVLLYPPHKSGVITLQVTRNQFEQIVESQLAEHSVDVTLEVSSASIAGLSVPMRRTLKKFTPTPVQGNMTLEQHKLVAVPRIPEALRTRLRSTPKNQRTRRKSGATLQ